jgi:uncharacterized Zn-binding protein involved in type VI secretion
MRVSCFRVYEVVPVLAVFIGTVIPSTVYGQSAPAPIVSGSPSVSVGGRPAAQEGDSAGSGTAITGGSTNVFINGRPAATVGSTTGCGGTIVTGSRNVFVNGKPLATAGSTTTPCAPR